MENKFYKYPNIVSLDEVFIDIIYSRKGKVKEVILRVKNNENIKISLESDIPFKMREDKNKLIDFYKKNKTKDLIALINNRINNENKYNEMLFQEQLLEDKKNNFKAEHNLDNSFRSLLYILENNLTFDFEIEFDYETDSSIYSAYKQIEDDERLSSILIDKYNFKQTQFNYGFDDAEVFYENDQYELTFWWTENMTYDNGFYISCKTSNNN